MINSFMFTAGQASTSFTASSKAKIGTVCSKTDSVTYYHNGSGALPSSGDIVYTDSLKTLPVQAGYYKLTLSYFTTGNGNPGEVTGFGVC